MTREGVVKVSVISDEQSRLITGELLDRRYSSQRTRWWRT